MPYFQALGEKLSDKVGTRVGEREARVVLDQGQF